MKYLMIALGFANGTPCPHRGQYLLSFDHEHDGGKGWGEFTKDRAKAKRFTKEPVCQPVRPDGKPNRPLTALSVTIEPVEE